MLILQDEIALQVACAVEPAIVEREVERTARKNVSEFDSLDYYYRGIWHLSRLSADDDAAALAAFRACESRDPLFALAQVGVSRALYAQAVYEDCKDCAGLLGGALKAARQAVALDRREAQAYFALAGAALYLGRHAPALESAVQATELNPGYAYAHYRAGQVRLFSGDPASAMLSLRTAIRCSPADPQLGPMMETLALCHFHLQDYEAAVHTAETSPTRLQQGSVILAASLARLGRVAEAAQAWSEIGDRQISFQHPRTAPYAYPHMLEDVRDAVRLARKAAAQTAAT